jgi:hypothetical protein
MCFFCGHIGAIHIHQKHANIPRFLSRYFESLQVGVPIAEITRRAERLFAN